MMRVTLTLTYVAAVTCVASVARRASRSRLERAVIVAVISVRAVEMVSHEVIDVIPVRHGLVPAALAVHVIAVVSVAAMLGRAALRTCVVDLQHVLVDVILVRVMQMPGVQVIDMVAMYHGTMATSRSMLVGMIRVNGVMLVHGLQCDRADRNCQTAESETQSHSGAPVMLRGARDAAGRP
jgi:hypothetical protein